MRYGKPFRSLPVAAHYRHLPPAIPTVGHADHPKNGEMRSFSGVWGQESGEDRAGQNQGDSLLSVDPGAASAFANLCGFAPARQTDRQVRPDSRVLMRRKCPPHRRLNRAAPPLYGVAGPTAVLPASITTGILISR